MKKFVRNILIFFAVVAVIDVVFGYVCRYMNSHAKGGDTQSHYYVAMECKEEILIFGSSRALHHYVPSIITDSLGFSCYNCGCDGNGIIYQYGRLQMIMHRYTPKVVLYDVFAAYDMIEDDHVKYLDLLKRYYNVPGIKSIFEEVAPIEQHKLYSQLYRYNNSFASMIMDYLKPMAIVKEGGYKPNYGVLLYEPESNKGQEVVEWDETKREYMIKFINLCKNKGVKLIFLYSPMYHAGNSEIYGNMTQLCIEHNVPLLDYYNDERFQVMKYQYDAGHLNDKGANEYTKSLISDLRFLINN